MKLKKVQTVRFLELTFLITFFRVLSICGFYSYKEYTTYTIPSNKNLQQILTITHPPRQREIYLGLWHHLLETLFPQQNGDRKLCKTSLHVHDFSLCISMMKYYLKRLPVFKCKPRMMSM